MCCCRSGRHYSAVNDLYAALAKRTRIVARTGVLYPFSISADAFVGYVGEYIPWCYIWVNGETRWHAACECVAFIPEKALSFSGMENGLVEVLEEMVLFGGVISEVSY